MTTNDVQAWHDGDIELHELIGLDAEAMQNLRGRAQFFVDGGHDERALIMLEMLEELDRTDIQPTLVAIDLLLRDGRSDAADAKIHDLLERAPDSPEVRVAWAELLVSAARLAEAAPILEALIVADPHAKTHAGARAHNLVARTLEQA